jgi:8-amino-7-oxononanoate synthase
VESRTPIQPVVIGDSARALAIAAALEDAGFHVPAVRPPTVAEGSARLRVILCALHAEAEVEVMLDALAAALHALPAVPSVDAASATARRG